MSTGEPDREQQSAEEEVGAPFTFKLMIALTVLYLGYRLVQGVVWLVQWARGLIG